MRRSGTYVLVFELTEAFHGTIGVLGFQHLDSDMYAYVGSARGGLDQRLSRHFRSQKAMRWHIDRLTVNAQKMKAYEFQEGRISECDLGNMLVAQNAIPVLKGFGCSDCRCETHLFSLDERCCAYIQGICDSVFENK